jgi:hypothetical protein
MVASGGPMGLGVLWIDQATPFQCSANGSETNPMVNPTAVQVVAETHDTPESPLCPNGLAPVGSTVA